MMIEIISEMGMRYVRIPFYPEKDNAIVSEYELNILKNTNIPGLAETTNQNIDGCNYLLFPIYSYISLEERLNKQSLNPEIFQDFFEQLLKVYEKMQMYLLDGTSVCLEPQYIFYNLKEDKYVFLPTAGEKFSPAQKFEKLFTYFADICPIEENILLGFIFENFSTLTEEQFEPQSFLKFVVDYKYVEDENDFLDETERNMNDYLENDEEETKDFDRTKVEGAFVIAAVLLFLSFVMAYLANAEYKYGVVSISASILAMGIIGIQVFKTAKYLKKNDMV